MLRRLAVEGPLSIHGLTRGTGVTRQAVTKHLGVLTDAGLVRGERRGRERVFQLERGPLERARHDLEAISARWDRALERLKAHVEA